ncbi:major facilitator superfamily domain-containing protein [Boeremia exigua]|uniref:major facilitator superfamily domain-containing protein n=1 Tax=Boeremia exigua TaxID=749465 RepID=UPI001E8ED74C|nr:major facilitator superfamily domain-containing protein [Boeremia exigua]KAH6625316.1 major facilitator superfamily domain-containing protein [Boeremia exigua]
MRTSMRPDDRHPHDEDEKAYDVNRPSESPSGDDLDSGRSSEEAQAGVKRIEAVSKAWTVTSLTIAYVTLMLLANITSLEIQVTSNLTAYATSSFRAHSLVSTVAVVQSVVSAVIKPPMGKIADVFGRLESFSLSILFYTLGYIQQAASNSVQTYAGAQVFWAAGFNGLQVLQQIFVADTTDLLNRALFSTIFDLPFLWTTWAGPEVAASILANSTWRWGYGIWAIVLPVCFIPLALSLFMNQRRAKSLGLEIPSPFKGKTVGLVFKNLWYDLDVFGLLLLATGISLILIPLTLAPNASGQWRNASMIAMLVIGGVVCIIFPFWERSKKLAPKAFFPPNLFKNRTVVAGVAIAFFYFMAFYMSVFPYFFSYLLIVQRQSLVTAGYITRVFTFASTVSSIVVSLFIKYTGHYKYFVTAGACIYIMGFGLMIAYRTENASTWTIIGTQVAVGIGGGFLNVPAQLAVQASASHQQVAAATTVFLTILEVGGAVGSAVSGAIWSSYVPSKLQQYLPSDLAPNYATIYGDLTVASNYTLYPVGTPERIAINRAYQETMRYMLIGAICAAVPILPLSLCLKNYKLDQMKQPVEGKVIGNSQKRETTKSWRFWGRKSNTPVVS